jgi:spore germination protein GerM
MTDMRGFGDDEAGRRLREVLAAEGRAIQPAAAGLARIQARIEAGRRRRGWWRSLAIGAAAAATAAIVIVVVLLVPSGNQGGVPVTVSPSPTMSGSRTPSPSPTPSAAPTHAPLRAALFYVGKKADPHQLLYREIVTRPWPAGNAVVTAAVNAMLTTPPRDPDYTSYWPAGTTIRGISLNPIGTHAVVDLSAEAGSASPGGSDIARISAWQLYYTVQQNGPKIDSVELRIDGKKVDSLWGTPIENPMTNDPYGNGQYLAHVWITSPEDGATVPQTIEIKGEAIAYEATVGWQILENDTVVKHGSTMASSGAPEQGSWSFSVALPPGYYIIGAYETSGTYGSPLYVDTKNITVQ